MTKNQIEYQKLVELRRSNQANEQLTARRDAETARSNLARETETARHNVQSLEESVRSHKTDEAHRARMQDEVERHNSVVESQSLIDLGIKQKQADVAQQRATEDARHNLATEKHNTEALVETQRSNYQNEAINRRRNDLELRSQSISSKRADIEKQRADTDSYRAGLEGRKTNSEIRLNTAKSAQSEKQTRLLTQSNIRDWIDLGGDTIMSLSKAKSYSAKALRDSIGSLKDVATTVIDLTKGNAISEGVYFYG